MKIGTKFVVGDEVWFLDRRRGRCPTCKQEKPTGWVSYVSGSFVVHDVNPATGAIVAFGARYPKVPWHFGANSVLYATEAEAQTECGRRNKEVEDGNCDSD